MINVRPASFVSDGKNGGTKGEVVVGCRVGSKYLAPEHVDALLRALDIPADAVDPDKYAALFG